MPTYLDRLMKQLGDATEHVIDCDAPPFAPDGCSVVEHRKGGVFRWDREAQRDALYLSKEQQDGKGIEGNKLRKKLEGKHVLNANVLDHLLAHPHVIPSEWKGKSVLFWGTIYHDRYDMLCVRYLFWFDGRWYSNLDWLDDWNYNYPAAVLAS